MTSDDITEITELIDKAVSPILVSLKKSEEATIEWRRNITRLIDRISLVVSGDKELPHKGLVQIVAEHEAFIAARKEADAVARGEKRVLVFLGGVAGATFTVLAEWVIPLMTHLFSHGR